MMGFVSKRKKENEKEENGKRGYLQEKSTSSAENRIVVLLGSIRERGRILERSKPGIQFIHWFSFGGITPSEEDL